MEGRSSDSDAEAEDDDDEAADAAEEGGSNAADAAAVDEADDPLDRSERVGNDAFRLAAALSVLGERRLMRPMRACAAKSRPHSGHSWKKLLERKRREADRGGEGASKCARLDAVQLRPLVTCSCVLIGWRKLKPGLAKQHPLDTSTQEMANGWKNT